MKPSLSRGRERVPVVPLKLRLTGYAYLVLYPGLATPIDAVSVLIVDGGKGILVDTGSGVEAAVKAVAASLAELGYPRRFSIEIAVNTHGHINNSGGDWWAHDVLKATIAARPPDSRWIEEGDGDKTAARDYGLQFRGVPVGLVIERDPYELSLDNITLSIIHTPGHTPGSQSIVVEGDDRLVVVGDALGSLSSKWGSSEKDWWKSLDRIKGLDPNILCTSVRCYIGPAAKEYLDMVEKEGPSWIDAEQR